MHPRLPRPQPPSAEHGERGKKRKGLDSIRPGSSLTETRAEPAPRALGNSLVGIKGDKGRIQQKRDPLTREEEDGREEGVGNHLGENELRRARSRPEGTGSARGNGETER